MRPLRAFIGILVAAFVVAAPAVAAVEVKGVDVSGHPTVRATVVTEVPTLTPPSLTENGQPAVGLTAENLGRAKSIVLAIDRSQSMEGEALDDAVAGARAFVAAKPPEDRIAILTYATETVLLTRFSTATIDADTALASIALDPVPGTKLYDAVVRSANAISAEELPARVIILLTDGNETKSESTLDDAIAAANDAGAPVYVIGIESSKFNPTPLRQLADETGGNYYGAASSDALADVYSSIAEELRRTWLVEFTSAALPGDRIALRAKSGGQTSAAVETRIPGSTPTPPKAEPSPILEPLLDSRFGPVAVGLAVTLLLLLAAAFAFAGKKGAWLTRRLEPHVAETQRVAIENGERLAIAAGLFRATERTFGHMKPWRHVASLLARADLPLRTVEFFYIASGSSLLVGIIAAAFSPPTLVVLGGLVGGALVPYLVVSFKARRRLRAFENQLPDLLITMAASLKAGHSFRQGMQAVIDEDQEPAAKEFKRVLAETRLGRPMDAALAEMANRIGSKNFEFVITAVTIQRQIGGSLAGIFDMVADTVRDRQQFARKIKGLTAMGRMSAYVLIGLPFFVLGVITLVNREYMSPLWHTSTGHKLLIVMLVMMGFGSLVLRKIVSFKG
jgi:tight adherence protein B